MARFTDRPLGIRLPLFWPLVALSLRDSRAMRSHDFVLPAPGLLPCLGRMATIVGLRVGCLRFLALFVSFLDGLDVSLFFELFVHCWLGFALMCCTSVEVFWFVVFWPGVSLVVSTHSTGT